MGWRRFPPVGFQIFGVRVPGFQGFRVLVAWGILVGLPCSSLLIASMTCKTSEDKGDQEF